MLRPVNRYKCQGFSLRLKNLRKYIIKTKLGTNQLQEKELFTHATKEKISLPVTVVPLNESESAFLQDERFQNPLILQEVGVPFYVL